MKNVTQAVVFPVSSITPTSIPEDLRDLFIRARTAALALDQANKANAVTAEAATTPADQEIAAAQAVREQLDKLTTDAKALADELEARAPEKLKAEVAAFGAKSLLDTVSVNMKLGTWLFDLYALSTPRPEAPLHQLIWNKRNMELAETVEKDEFELPAWSVPAIRKGLLDDAVWTSSNLSAWVELVVEKEGDQPQRRYLTIKSMGAAFFNQIMEAAAVALYDESMKSSVK